MTKTTYRKVLGYYSNGKQFFSSRSSLLEQNKKSVYCSNCGEYIADTHKEVSHVMCVKCFRYEYL